MTKKWVFEDFYPTFSKLLQPSLAYKLKIFIDENIDCGDKKTDKIITSLAKSKLLICIWSGYYFTRDWCVFEYKSMRYREKRLNMKLIIPIKVTYEDDFPTEIEDIEPYDFRNYFLDGIRLHTETYIAFQINMKKVVKDVCTILRSKIPDWDASWLKKNFFKQAISKIPLTKNKNKKNIPDLGGLD